MFHTKKKLAGFATIALATPLLMVGAATAASADSAVTWSTSNGCLEYGLSWPSMNVNQDYLMVSNPCSTGPYAKDTFVDVNQGSNQWLEKPSADQSLCMTAWTDNSVYFETCKPGNKYERWIEIHSGTAWFLQNVGTGRFLETNSNGQVITGATWQIWH